MKNRLIKRFALALMLGSGWMSWALAQDSTEPADLPSAESILDRYVEVTGGVDAYESLTSTVAQGTMEISAAGITGQLEVYIKPGQYFMHVELPGVGTIDSGVTDGIAWENSALTGPRILTGAEAQMSIMGADPAAQAHWRDIFSQVETTGIEDVNGEPSYVVDLVMESGFEISNSYSIDSGLLLKQAMTISAQGIQIQLAQYMHDYSETGGVLSPGRVVIDQGVANVVLTFTSGEANVDIPDERFAIPEAVQAILQ